MLIVNILITKSLRIQTKYMGTQVARGAQVHHRGLLGVFFLEYEPVEEVSSVKHKEGITTSNFKLMVILIWKRFNEVLNVLTYGG